MFSKLEKYFEKIGAGVCVVSSDAARRRRVQQTTPIRLNIITRNGKEVFEVAVRKDLASGLEVDVLEVIPEDRHLVLCARRTSDDGRVITKDHFLCGHDERHFFVALIAAVSTVAEGKASLKPPEIREMEAGLNTKKRNRRKTKNFLRQGEWFFVPANVTPDEIMIRKYEPLSRGRGSKAHIAQFAYRRGGEAVKVCTQFPTGLTEAEYRKCIEENPSAKYFNWRDMQRDATVFVKGTIRHPDHATIVLDTWHRVYMNTEQTRPGEAIAFLD